MSNRRISLDGLALTDGSSGQYFAGPDGYALDSAERLVVAVGDDSLQDEIVGWLAPAPEGEGGASWPADTTMQWGWQDGFVLSDSGELELIQWDGESALSLDVVNYGANGLRRTFAGREAEVAGDDFESGGWSLGTSALERKEVKFGFGESYSWTQIRGGKNYELSDHLGNVAVVVGDRRLAVDGNVDLAVDFFEGEILSARDFYPFGMVMPERSFSTESYRYGFNGKEFDSEWKGEGNSYDYGARIYDGRLGKWLSVDPLGASYPGTTPFAFACNTPVQAYDPSGELVLFVNGLRFWTRGNDQDFSKKDGQEVGPRAPFSSGNYDPIFGLYPRQRERAYPRIYANDVYNYWATDQNSFGEAADIARMFMDKIGDHNDYYMSGSSSWRSSAADRHAEGAAKAFLFHQMVENGDINLEEGESIKIVSHSQGGAHSAGFANQLMKFKDKDGNQLYNVEIIYYLTPHQPTDIRHPEEIKGKQYSSKNDAVSSNAPFWLPNGGSKFGAIPGLGEFLRHIYSPGFNPTNCDGPNGNRCGHNSTDQGYIGDISEGKKGAIELRKDNLKGGVKGTW